MRTELDFFEISVLIESVWNLDYSCLEKIMKHNFIQCDKDRLLNINGRHNLEIETPIHKEFIQFLNHKTKHTKFEFYEANFNEVLVLIKSCYSARTGVRMSFIEKIINSFDKFNKSEVLIIWDETKNFKIDENSEYQKKFLARFDINNQYAVTGKYKKQEQTFNAFLYDNNYYIQFNTNIISDYITNIDKIHYEN